MALLLKGQTYVQSKMDIFYMKGNLIYQTTIYHAHTSHDICQQSSGIYLIKL
ncbi:MAG: hypothetical protein IPI18_09010 [Saprospiraceae bacterium]|nr:hypothetical protein [Saprospiraceae bacterium]